MKRMLPKVTLLGALLCLLCATPALALETDGLVRAGLYYGSGALPTANLENSVGSGYRFGFLDEGDGFVELASTGETQITMVKTQNLYLKNGAYSTGDPGGADKVIGCYHLQLPGTYYAFSQAREAAGHYPDGFAAWIDGAYYARVGAWATRAQAEAAQSSLGLGSASIVGTSAYGIAVTQTGSGTLLFQFDDASHRIFAVDPGQGDGAKTTTWFKGYRYYGDFLYERQDGGDLTVVNLVPMDDYLKGVLPYEMSASWPLEALKAQAVCARSYAMTVGSKHASQHFDLCAATDCQVYRGLNSANANTDRAVEETHGVCARYGGQVAQTYYYASNGGASEDVANVWGSTIPYLRGVADPYEATVAGNISNYYWQYTFTRAELTQRLRDRGVDCATIVDVRLTGTTALGNVAGVAFTDANGQVFTYARERARTVLGLPSMRFQISGSGEGAGGTGSAAPPSRGMINGLEALGAVAVLSGREMLPPLVAAGLSAATTAATQSLTADTTTTTTPVGGSDSFTITGSGNGHHVGMSQWGAYAMAQQGYTYRDILTFYYTGIDLY